MEKRDSLIFYRSFYEAIRELPKDNQAEVYDAIFLYALDFTEPKLSGISKTIFTLIKPQLDANISKFKNGKLPKLPRSKKEANDKQNESKEEGNVNCNVNAKENKNIYRKFAHLSITEIEHQKLVTEYGEENVSIIYDEIQNYKKNKNYTSLYLTANNWLKKRNPQKTTSTTGSNQRGMEYPDDGLGYGEL